MSAQHHAKEQTIQKKKKSTNTHTEEEKIDVWVKAYFLSSGCCRCDIRWHPHSSSHECVLELHRRSATEIHIQPVGRLQVTSSSPDRSQSNSWKTILYMEYQCLFISRTVSLHSPYIRIPFLYNSLLIKSANFSFLFDSKLILIKYLTLINSVLLYWIGFFFFKNCLRFTNLILPSDQLAICFMALALRDGHQNF